MAVEYEAIIALLPKKIQGCNKVCKGNVGNRKKPNAETYAKKEKLHLWRKQSCPIYKS